jgi:hypothetical protein
MTYLRGHTQIRPMHMAMPIGIDVGAIESNTHSWDAFARFIVGNDTACTTV